MYHECDPRVNRCGFGPVAVGSSRLWPIWVMEQKYGEMGYWFVIQW